MSRSKKGSGAEKKNAGGCCDGCESGCGCGGSGASCGFSGMGDFRVEAVATVDARGQMVLPKDVRTKAKIGSDEKLAVITCMDGDETCCLCLIKVEDMDKVLRMTLGPVLDHIARKQ